MFPNPERAAKIRAAYQPIRDDSTFEFTVEAILVLEGTALVAGSITKGAIHEGYRLQMIRAEGTVQHCTCLAIAGITERLSDTSLDSGETNIALWLDIPPTDVSRYDRLLSTDTPSMARRVTPAEFRFSLMYGVARS